MAKNGLPTRSGFILRRHPLLAAFAGALLSSSPPSAVPASADPAPVKIAVFDFELDDSSAGAGIAGATSRNWTGPRARRAGLSRTPDAIVWSTSLAPQERV
jgi:hypothetical protein